MSSGWHTTQSRFLTAMGFGQTDILGFLYRQLHRPGDRADLAGPRPQADPGVLGPPRRGRHARAGRPTSSGPLAGSEANPEGYLDVFFARSIVQPAGQPGSTGGTYARTEDRDKPTTWATREAQYDAVCTWGIPDHRRCCSD